MKAWVCVMVVFFLAIFLSETPVAAQEDSSIGNITVTELATAIDAWANNSQWWECGAPIKTRTERAAAYAGEFFRVAEANKLSPLMLAAIVEQESGYDECQVGKPTRDRVGLPMHPSYENVYAELGTREKRSAHGISYFDAGAAQFLWPRASNFNSTEGVSLREVMDEAWSIGMLGKTLSIFRSNAMADRPNGYTFRTEKGRAVHVPAESGFFIHHNSPGATNHKYFWSVRSRGLRILKSIREQRGIQKTTSLLLRPLFRS